MENEFFTEEITYSSKRKFKLELQDLLAGLAFPVIISVLFSSTIIAFAASNDITVSLLSLIGGELMLVVALVIFGRANGTNAYKNTLLNAQKRELGSREERVHYKTGEYALWKAVLIGGLVSLPFIIFQTVELIVPNFFTSFCLRYICAWAFYPFSYLGEAYQPLNYVMILLPVAVHLIGYVLGKYREIKIWQAEAEAEATRGKKGRKKK